MGGFNLLHDLFAIRALPSCSLDQHDNMASATVKLEAIHKPLLVKRRNQCLGEPVQDLTMHIIPILHLDKHADAALAILADALGDYVSLLEDLVLEVIAEVTDDGGAVGGRIVGLAHGFEVDSAGGGEVGSELVEGVGGGFGV